MESHRVPEGNLNGLLANIYAPHMRSQKESLLQSQLKQLSNVRLRVHFGNPRGACQTDPKQR